jgi:hypothetical protein
MPVISSVSSAFGFGRSGGVPVIPLAGSLLFNGNTNTYLKITPGVALGSGAYTIECWFYNNNSWDVGAPRALLGGGPDGVTGCMSLFFSNSTTITTDSYGGLGQRSYTVGAISLNTWHHFVLVRNASNVETVFIDGIKATGASGGTGVSGGQQTNSINYSGVSMNVGKYYGGVWTGYFTNMRLVVGTAVYNPTAASITVPRTGPLAVINPPNTKYLMLGASVTADDSSTQTVTNNLTSVTQTSVKPF